jgi:hypothetical protein
MFQPARQDNCHTNDWPALKRPRGGSFTYSRTPRHVYSPEKTRQKPFQAHALEPTGSQKLWTAPPWHGGCFVLGRRLAELRDKPQRKRLKFTGP